MPITPADVLAERAAGPRARGATTDDIPPENRGPTLESIMSSYFGLRQGMAIIGLIFPIALWIGGGWRHLQTSLSTYYHYSFTPDTFGSGTMRDVFVGVLWTIGGFLFFYKGYVYKGYERGEDWALNLAGL